MQSINKDTNIVLAGFMGTGKTTIGKLLAQKLKRDFVDTDSIIEERMQMKISEIFAEKGEEFFRNIESQIIAEVSTRANLIIAIGGGAVLRKDNLDNLSKKGIIVCLKASLDEILRRIGDKKDRPLIEKENKKEALARLMKQREPIYKALPIQIQTDGKSPVEIVEAIIKNIF